MYVLMDQSILHINEKGETVGTFSRRGQGPGELSNPTRIGFMDSKLWVIDLARTGVMFFSRDGEYLNTIDSKKIFPAVLACSNGLLSIHHSLGRSEQAVIHFISDLPPHKTTLLAEWQPEWVYEEPVFETVPSRFPFSPVREEIHFRVGDEGKFAFLIPSGPTLSIHVFNLESKKLDHIIQRDEKPLEFNADWGMKKMKQAEERERTPFTLSNPEFFPLVRDFHIDSGVLVIEKWSYDPDTSRSFLTLDVDGLSTQLDYDPVYSNRIIHRNGDDVYLSGYDNATDHAIVFKCKRSELNATAKANPIEYEPPKTWVRLK